VVIALFQMLSTLMSEDVEASLQLQTRQSGYIGQREHSTCRKATKTTNCVYYLVWVVWWVKLLHVCMCEAADHIPAALYDFLSHCMMI
jgi:hypothetical protein